MRKAKGTETPEGRRQIAIKLDEELFELLAQEAAAKRLSFNALVRFYIKQGMQK